jgi:hypothetical protein
MSNAVTWAFGKAHPISNKGLPTSALLVLTAFAQAAVEDLDTANGYTGTATWQVANMVALSEPTVRKHANALVSMGVLNFYGHLFRLPEAAFGNEA